MTLAEIALNATSLLVLMNDCCVSTEEHDESQELNTLEAA